MNAQEETVKKLIAQINSLMARLTRLENSEGIGFTHYETGVPTDNPPNGAVRVVHTGGADYLYARSGGMWVKVTLT